MKIFSSQAQRIRNFWRVWWRPNAAPSEDMRVGAWNCRGLKCTDALVVPYLRRLVSSQAFDFLFLSETRIAVKELESLISSLGFKKWGGYDYVGLSGGLILWWASSLEVSILFVSPNYVCCNVIDECNVAFTWCVCMVLLLWRTVYKSGTL